jgi:SNF2-related domain
MGSIIVPKQFILKPAQIPMIPFMRSTPRCGLWADMGLGKTSAVLMIIDMMMLLGELDFKHPALVIGPARVAKDTWTDEAAKWAQFKDIIIVPLCGTPTERIQKLKIPAHIYTISYELLPWLVEYWMGKWPYRTVIADELERLKGFREKAHHEKRHARHDIGTDKSGKSGKRAHAIGRVAHNLTDRWINLGGTPAPAGLKDLWGSTWFLDRGARLGRTFTDFKNRWFRLKWSGTGIEPLPYADEQIHAALKDICLTIDPADYYDLEKPIVTPLHVTLPPRARALYRQMEKELFFKLENGAEVNALTQAGLTNKCLQLANGFAYTERPAWEKIHDEKIQALESVVSEAASSALLVQTSYRPDVPRILGAIRGAVDISTSRGLAAFKSGDSCVGVAHPGSMGHGIDGLQYVTNRLVRFGHVWKLSETMQYLGRIGPVRQFNAGFKRAVHVQNIIAKDTLDEDVLDSHENNRSVQDALLLAMKRRG